MTETFDWLKPSPLWAADGSDANEPEFFRPRVLELQDGRRSWTTSSAAGSGKQPALAGLAAKPQGRQAGSTGQATEAVPAGPRLLLSGLRLALLPNPGLPGSGGPATGDGESAFFVLRKLIDGAEYAWVGRERRRLEAARRDRSTGSWPARSAAAVPDARRMPPDAAQLRLPARRQPRDLRRCRPKAGRRRATRWRTHASRSSGRASPSPLTELVRRSRRCADPAPPRSSSAATTSRDLSVYLLLKLWEYLHRSTCRTSRRPCATTRTRP